MTTAVPFHRHSPLPHQHQPQSHRHHPYSSSAPRKYPAAQPNGTSACEHEPVPPSPPRSRRDHSETPSSLGLGVAFGGAAGGKWWDEELPAPPASLSAILDSFRRSGEGDRDLLLSILGAKKAEEERLTALIQTRLTILQARLSLHSAAAAALHSRPDLPSPRLMPPPPPGIGLNTMPIPMTSVPSRSPDPRANPLPSPPIRGTTSPTFMNAPAGSASGVERTPSLSGSRGSGSSAGAVSPQMQMTINSYSARMSDAKAEREREHDQSCERDRDRPYVLPPPSSYWRREEPATLPPIRVDPSTERQLGPSSSVKAAHKDSIAATTAALQGRHDDRGCCPRDRQKGAGGARSTSPRSTGSGSSPRQANGLDMLLDAGRRAEGRGVAE